MQLSSPAYSRKKYLFDSEMGARIRNALVAHSRQLANVQTCTYTCKNVVVYLSVGVCKLLLLLDVVVESWMHMLISTISDYLYIHGALLCMAADQLRRRPALRRSSRLSMI